MRLKLIDWWALAVSAFLVLGGAIGLFTDDIGPLPTNRIHAVGLNLGVGLLGFGFARFGAEALFVLLSGIGMVTLATIGFLPQTSTWLYTTLHMNRFESWFELIAGVISLAIYFMARAAAAGGAARTTPAQPPQTH
ncbi:MAG TPA: hypothetical protein VFQ65_21070 [Kofleriaceae bacterium]|nr:hypothetical protein [Kofleriaceae bacterium]